MSKSRSRDNSLQQLLFKSASPFGNARSPQPPVLQLQTLAQFREAKSPMPPQLSNFPAIAMQTGSKTVTASQPPTVTRRDSGDHTTIKLPAYTRSQKSSKHSHSDGAEIDVNRSQSSGFLSARERYQRRREEIQQLKDVAERVIEATRPSPAKPVAQRRMIADNSFEV